MISLLPSILATLGLFIGFSIPGLPYFGNNGTINQLSPFVVSTNQVRLASTTANFRIPSLTSKDCIGTDSNGVLEEGTCTGGSGSFPFSAASNFGQVVYATATPTLWFQSGVFASSTSQFANSTTSLATIGTAWLTNLFIGADTIAEYVADTAGAMFTGNTETGISITYQDADNTIDAVISGLVSSMFSDADWGEVTVASGVVTIDDNMIESEHLGDDDWGDITIATNVASVEDDSHAHTGSTISGIDVSADTNLTAGDGLTITDDDLDCDTASGSVFGCLSAANWTTFNSKLGSYDAWTHPQTGSSATTSGMIFTAASSTFVGGLSVFNGTTTNATSTNLYVSGQTRLAALSSALPLAGSTGILSNYAGTSCTNQFVRSLSAAGAATCATVSSSDVSLANLTATDSTLTFSGTYNGSTARTIGINLGNANTWTALQTFSNSTTTLASFTYSSSTDAVIGRTLTLFGTAYTTLAALGNALVNAVTAVTPTGTWDFGGATSVEIVNGSSPTVDAIGEVALDTTANELLIATSTTATAPGVMKMWQPIRFSYASSTQGMGTTTRSLGVAPAAGYLEDIQCDFSNFMRIMIYDGTNRLNDLVASSTIGTVKFTTNQAFTAGEAMRVDIGTTTNINANVYGGCTAKFFYTRN